MATAMQQSAFLGTSLKRSTAPLQPAQTPRVAPVQAFFKKAEKNVKKAASAAQPAKGKATQVVRQAQKAAPKAANRAQTQASKAASQAKGQAKKGGLGLPSFGTAKKEVKKAAPKKPAQQVKRALPKAPVQQAKKAVSQAKKAAPRPPQRPVQKAKTQVKKAAPSPRPVQRQLNRASKAGGSLDQWYGPSRALYLPRGLLDPNDIPSYLNGSLAGDYGYDPLGLGKDGNVEKYRAYELIHARWAMLAAAGIVIPEGLQANGASIKGGTWFETGAEMLDGGTLNYFAVPWGIVNNPLPLFAVVAVEVALIGAVETYRRSGEGPPGYSPGKGGGKFDSSVFQGLDNLYPGGPFDPLGLADDPEALQELKVKEIKNGRLALVSVLGFAVQGYVTGEGPYANWAKHVSDPFGYNLLTILSGEDRLPTL